jgi:hypothetical protein
MQPRRLLATFAIALFALAVHADNPPITVNVDVAANRHVIDERIYGAAWANAAQITTFRLPLNRWGGNAMSRYNWVFSTANRCKDYYFYNIPETPTPGPHPAGWNTADDFIEMTRDAAAQPVMTIPMLSLLPKDATKRCSFPQAGNPTQEEYSNPAWEPVICGNGRLEDGNGIVGDGPRILGLADPNNTATSYPLSHQGDWVQHMIDTWGSADVGGMRYYSLDNEPHLWSFDHWDVHPTGTSYDEAWTKMRDLAAIIRAKDASAVITGGEEWGWWGYFMSGLDIENNNSADRDAHGGAYFYDWLLDQFQAYEQNNDVRLLDVITVHYYPQSGEFWSGSTSNEMQDLRNRSTRSLWDPNYIDESWIPDMGIDGGKVRLIPRLKEWVANHYPGTLIGITEYNWGDVNHINGATAQADILGIFGREGLNVGIRWTAPAVGSFAGNVFRMYRNYNGTGASFGEMSVSASGPNPDQVAVFASERTPDGALTIMLISKGRTGDTPTTINLANFNPGYPIERMQLTSTNVLTQLPNMPATGNSVVLTLPQQSITLLVIPPYSPNPPVLTATATSTSQVALSWTPVDGAVNYEVQRSFNNGAFESLPLTASTSTTDSGLVANATYLYHVRALLAASQTHYSNVDPATTIVFTDSPLVAGTPVKIAHIAQLRTAVNAMRTASNLPPQVFTDDPLTTSTTIKATHLNQLRTALDPVRFNFGMPALTYTDNPATTATTIKAVHITELRDGVK